jgi:signal recognition particle GTPase
MRGFTLGVSDILVQPAADARRHTALEQLRRCGPQVIIDTFHLSPATADRHHMQQAMNRAYCPRRGDVSDVKQLDYNMKQATDKYNDVINK